MTKPSKRPRDFSQAAKLVIDVDTGQVNNSYESVNGSGRSPVRLISSRRGKVQRKIIQQWPRNRSIAQA